ncbi:hypothetical protein L207DRAFT_217024 [Hyaloscypha variabilis F]|uniref:Uncharacterized protein n=1 Tax=Hyaloscypha variabilis (strain UAMH 11265 / GT02V1 / F) TaxID=1149755 RepID=A0A2J6S741_HYAVF|nr:hypothetical protein L207DRAFT_217024 [Hyaloscypha variabilis F]
MWSATRFLLLLNLHFFSLVAAISQREQPQRPGIKWLEEERSVLVRLETPDLPLWNVENQIGEDLPSALIFNFTLSHDYRTLMLNEVPILPLENAYVPPRLFAYQSSETLTQFDNDPITDYNSCPLFSLDYSRIVPQAEDSSQKYYNYTLSLELDILGASIAEYNALLPANNQNFIRVTLNQADSRETHISLVSFKIGDISLEERGSNNQFQSPESLKTCTAWSWLCADKPGYPWYQYIYRQHFDEYGRIHSMRWLVHFKWATLIEVYGVVQVAIITSAVGIVALSLLGYGIYRISKRAQALWQRRIGDVDAWTAEEEIGGLLDDEEEEEDDDYDRRAEVEMEDWTGSHRQKPLPPPPLPPPVPPKAGEPSRS